MAERLDSVRISILRFEGLLTAALVTAVFVSIVMTAGGLELSSDSLNHHFYLGWIAESNRFGTDFLGASYQSYQWPYLYWPVYKLAAMGASGVTAGVALALLHALIVPPVWMLARYLVPGESYYEIAMRLMGVALAFSSIVILLSFRTTGNDLLSAIPMTWSIAFAVKGRAVPTRTGRYTLLSGFLAGMAVACKLSNGPLAIVLPVVWCFNGPDRRSGFVHLVGGSVATLFGFLMTYGLWGVELWRTFGHPLFPQFR